jgi:porin
MARAPLACTTALILILATPALAQVSSSPPPPADAQSEQAIEANQRWPESLNIDKPEFKGPFATVGSKLADDGIRFRALLTNEVATNTTGGANQGTTNVGQVYIGADADLEKLVGWEGGKVHLTVYQDYGHGLSKNDTGTFFKQQDIYKNEFPYLHVGLISFEQLLLDDRLDVVVGRLGTTAFYGHLQPNCYFQQGTTCGVPVVLNSEAGFSLLPSATWGGNVKYKITDKMYVEAGAFEVNPTTSATQGLDFSTAAATGVTVPFELGYENADFKKVRFPYEWKIGGYASTGDRTDPYYNAKNQSAGLTNTALRNATSLRSGVYIMGDRTVWRPDPQSLKSISLFGGWVQPLESDEIIDRQVYGGMLLRGPFQGREQDTIGFSATYLHVSAKEMAYLRDNRIRLHGGGIENPNEFAFELNYGIQLGNATRLTPNVQYVVNPDSSAIPKINFVPKNIVTFGLKLTMDLARLSGLPPSSTSE